MANKLHFCPYCLSGRIRRIWDKSRWDYCEECGLYFRNPMPTQNELDALYNISWTAPDKQTSETGGTTLLLARIYVNHLIHSLGLRTFEGLRILDFGAGRGAMLQALKEKGAEVVGIEPYGIEYLKSKGFEIYTSVQEVKGEFDGIIAIDVIEHLREPWHILKELSSLLKQGGWIYVSTGNPLGLNARIYKGNWREAKKAGHLLFPSPKTLEKWLKEAGFIKVKRLKWFIKYHRNPIRLMLNYILQMIGLDGGLRYLAWM